MEMTIGRVKIGTDKPRKTKSPELGNVNAERQHEKYLKKHAQ